jgi:hypothetical protein
MSVKTEDRPVEVSAIIKLLGLLTLVVESSSVALRFRVANSLRDAADLIERGKNT